MTVKTVKKTKGTIIKQGAKIYAGKEVLTMTMNIGVYTEFLIKNINFMAWPSYLTDLVMMTERKRGEQDQEFSILYSEL